VSDAGRDDEGELLDAELLARLERLQLGTRRKLAGRFSGEHRSRRHGSSLDFADVREYHPGDDYRRIDYPLYARTDQLFIRLFDAEDDLDLRLVVDRSASMAVEGKLRTASRLAAALGFVGLVRRDVVTVHAWPDDVPARRFNGRGATGPLFSMLGGLTPAGGTDLAAAATSVLARTGPPGVTVLISDLLSPSWPSAIERLPGRGADVTIVHVLAPSDLEPGFDGDLELVDAETGERVVVSMTPEARRDYRSAVQAWLDDVTARCRSRGVGYVRVSTADDVVDVVLRGWQDEGLLR
jgi:uncharacterized protein (DUF58 family)